ncbi:MAG: RsmB/NOP family class I SAM-dependent RNA methyltransferase [Alphaproteobacteria bacterium]
MRPGARVQAAIDLVAAIEEAQAAGRAPADSLIQQYFRKRRYAGSKDRRAVIDLVYEVQRTRGMLTWRLGGSEASTPRLLVLLACAQPVDASLFDGAHTPEPLSEEEIALLGRASSVDEADAPDWARFNVPEWLIPHIRGRFGDGLETEMAALEMRAPLDIRVNVLRGSIEQAQEALPDAVPGGWAPCCLRLTEARSLTQDQAYKDGLIEIQDEGSQIAALLCDAKPGMQVLDLCAGGGGKTLALAAQMGNSGQIFAYDNEPKRLAALKPRANRSDARSIQYPKTLNDLSQKMDRVVLDMPCSGSGTWRRSPDLRWRLTEERLGVLLDTQSKLLDQGAGFVKPGGQLIYIVCSILKQEAEDQITAFLNRHAEFRVRPYRSNWFDPDAAPHSLAESDEMLLMTPASHGTDGFFVAVLQHGQ